MKSNDTEWIRVEANLPGTSILIAPFDHVDCKYCSIFLIGNYFQDIERMKKIVCILPQILNVFTFAM